MKKVKNTEQEAGGSRIVAIVGMPGAGKSEAVSYLRTKGLPFVRFGEATDERVRKLGIPLTPDNERKVREGLRKELGMAAYAVKALPRIEQLVNNNHRLIVLDGLYSWEEYVFLKEKFQSLILVCIFAEPSIRYKRLSQRPIRPIPEDQARERDIAELEQLNKGGPIAIADHIVVNNTNTLADLHTQLDTVPARIMSSQ